LVRRGTALNADRFLNRFFTYPRHVRRVAGTFNMFHIVDHSYSQLVHSLPADRTGVYCHDLDAFRCVLEPQKDPRRWWFRKMAERILGGMQKAALVFHNSHRTRTELLSFKLVDEAKLVHAPLGIAPEFVAESPGEPPHLPWLGETIGRPWLLHVGSCIPRKRADVLLDVFAAVRRARPDLMLVKVGGDWTAAHREQIRRHGLQSGIVHVTGLSRLELAEVYRRASLVLLPSEAEGFGLPIIEALACGSPVLASDIPVLREVGGGATAFAPVGDVAGWAAEVKRLIDDPTAAPGREHRIAHASQYSWAEHARIIGEAYLRLLGQGY
jgi:glycosyltransferase involved in cell wall biosynthesis